MIDLVIWLYRVTSFVLRFISNLKSAIKKDALVLNEHITLEEYEQARYLSLKSNQDVLRSESNFRNLEMKLNLFEDSKSIIRSKGRVANADLPYNTKYPIMISRNHKLADLIVWDSHNTVMHRGEKQTLTELRAEYWIVKSKGFIKRFVHVLYVKEFMVDHIRILLLPSYPLNVC